MSLRNEVLTCIRERVLNLSTDGAIFRSTEDHLNWLLGVGSGSKGFMQDPKRALEQTLRSNASAFHSGIQINQEEESELMSCVESIIMRNVPMMAGGPEMDGWAADCKTDPYGIGCWY